MRHPRDPVAAHDAADCFGRLLALGLLDQAETVRVLGEVAAPGVDRSGLRARLMHTLFDTFDHATLRRQRAATRVRKAVAPLLDAWAPAPAVLRAAAEAAGDELEAGEAEAIAAGLAAAVLRRRA